MASSTPDPLGPDALQALWEHHLDGEFGAKDVEATLATMVDDAVVTHMPVGTGGQGKDELRRFYRDDFIPAFPDDFTMTPISRCVGVEQLVDEIELDFTHSRPMPWLLPEVAPTGRHVRMRVVVIVQFRGDKLACERIYWDHLAVLRQVGLLPA